MKGIVAAGMSLVLLAATSCSSVRTTQPFNPQTVYGQSCLQDCRTNNEDCNSAKTASTFLLLPLFIVGITLLVLGGGGGGNCGGGNWGVDGGGRCSEAFRRCDGICRGVEMRASRR